MSELPTEVGATFKVRRTDTMSQDVFACKVVTRPLAGKAWVRELAYLIAGHTFPAAQAKQLFELVENEEPVSDDYVFHDGTVIPGAAVDAVLDWTSLGRDDAARVALAVLQALNMGDW